MRPSGCAQRATPDTEYSLNRRIVTHRGRPLLDLEQLVVEGDALPPRAFRCLPVGPRPGHPFVECCPELRQVRQAQENIHHTIACMVPLWPHDVVLGGQSSLNQVRRLFDADPDK